VGGVQSFSLHEGWLHCGLLCQNGISHGVVAWPSRQAMHNFLSAAAVGGGKTDIAAWFARWAACSALACASKFGRPWLPDVHLIATVHFAFSVLLYHVVLPFD